MSTMTPSSKYPVRNPQRPTSMDFEDRVIDTHLIKLESRNLAHKSRITYHENPWCQEWPHPPSIQSGTLNILQVWTLRTGGSWHTSNQARELKFGTQVKNHISWLSMMSRMSGTINILQVHHGGCGVPDTLCFMVECLNLAHIMIITYQDDLWNQGWLHPPSPQSGTINILQVHHGGWGVLDPLFFMVECWNLAHMLIITYQDDLWNQGWPHPQSPQSWTIYVFQGQHGGQEGSWFTLIFLLDCRNGVFTKKQKLEILG